MNPFPTIPDEDTLDEVMTRPRSVLVDFIRQVHSPLVILGAGGKMGPSLAVLARRAAEEAGHPLEVTAVSRFSDPKARAWLEERGVRTLSLDLMERSSYANLPDSENVAYLVGLKFGTTGNPAATWATMVLPAALTCERYPGARITALSSGNVYPLSAVGGPGSAEGDPLTPLGEYSNACVARERIFEYSALKNGTPLALIRLFYAVDLRYGVLMDLADKILRGEVIDLQMGYLNCIWQGDANEMILRSLALAANPPTALNLTGSEALAVRDLAVRLGQVLGREVKFAGTEAGTALLADCRKMVERLGELPTPVDVMIRWTAAWALQGGRTLNKPTHFETRDGRY
jgi:hypothetical protein